MPWVSGSDTELCELCTLSKICTDSRTVMFWCLTKRQIPTSLFQVLTATFGGASTDAPQKIHQTNQGHRLLSGLGRRSFAPSTRTFSQLRHYRRVVVSTALSSAGFLPTVRRLPAVALSLYFTQKKTFGISTIPDPMCRRMPGLEFWSAGLSSASVRTLRLAIQSRHTMHDK